MSSWSFGGKHLDFERSRFSTRPAAAALRSMNTLRSVPPVQYLEKVEPSLLPGECELSPSPLFLLPFFYPGGVSVVRVVLSYLLHLVDELKPLK